MRAVWQKKHPENSMTSFVPDMEGNSIYIDSQKKSVWVDNSSRSTNTEWWISICCWSCSLSNMGKLWFWWERDITGPSTKPTPCSASICVQGTALGSAVTKLWGETAAAELSIQLVQKVCAARSTSDPRTKRLNSGSPPPSDPASSTLEFALRSKPKQADGWFFGF